MSKKCTICEEVKGKRGCSIHGKRLICPRCCAEIRGADCTGCGYYQEANRYHASRKKPLGSKEFIIEVDEEIDAAVDQAMAAVEQRKFRKAEKLLNSLMQAHPDHYMVSYGMGVLFAMRERYDQAIEYFKKAVEVFPLFLEAHYNLAIAYKSIFDVANMVRTLRHVVELAEPGSEYHHNAQDLLRVAEQSMSANNGYGLEAYINGQDEFDRAFKLMENGDWKGAIKGFQRSIRLCPDMPQPHGNIGICHGKLGQKQEALLSFEKALEIDPDYEPALINKRATEQLIEGQCLPDTMQTTRYFGGLLKNGSNH